MKATQNHINIIDELRNRAIRDKAQLAGVLLADELGRFDVAIAGLEATQKRMKIDLLEQTKKNLTEELGRLNA